MSVITSMRVLRKEFSVAECWREGFQKRKDFSWLLNTVGTGWQVKTDREF